jgi:hypothetical protein
MHRARRHPRLALLLLVCVGVLAAPAQAHEFWAEPDAWRPRAGAELPIHLKVGDPPEVEAFPASDRHRKSFEVHGRRVVAVTPGAHKTEPAGRVTLTAPGPHWLVYRSHESTTTLAPDRFAAYLKEEGLEAEGGALWRALDPEQRRPVREAFSRCVKALVHARDACGRICCDPCVTCRPVGLPLELVPLRDPATLRPGAHLPVRLLLHGRPAAGRHVLAMPLDAKATKRHLTTDRFGVAWLTLDTAGTWLVASIKLEARAPGGEVDLASTWTSLTFRVEGCASTR